MRRACIPALLCLLLVFSARQQARADVVTLTGFDALNATNESWFDFTSQQSGFIRINEAPDDGYLIDIPLGSQYDMTAANVVLLSGRLGPGNTTSEFQIQIVAGGTIVGRINFQTSSFSGSLFTEVAGEVVEGNFAQWDEVDGINIIGLGDGSGFLDFDFDRLAADATTGYSIWASGALSGGDANNDGINNLLAYAIGASEPLDNTARSRLIKINANLSVTQNYSARTDVRYTMEISTNLISWFPVAVKNVAGSWTLNAASGYPNQTSISQSGDIDGNTAITFSDSSGGTKKFWRLVVSQ